MPSKFYSISLKYDFITFNAFLLILTSLLVVWLLLLMLWNRYDFEVGLSFIAHSFAMLHFMVSWLVKYEQICGSYKKWDHIISRLCIRFGIFLNILDLLTFLVRWVPLLFYDLILRFPDFLIWMISYFKDYLLKSYVSGVCFFSI